MFSEIKWGTRIKPNPTDPTDVLYQLPSKVSGKEKWGSTKSDFRITRTDVESEYWSLYRVRFLPKTWVFNAFGPLAIRFFKDKNANRRLDRGEEHVEGAMFHTTAEDEAAIAQGRAVGAGYSHGCIHLRPQDRDTLIALGALKAGNMLIVHEYWERYGAAATP